jgi:hypothetical protein
MVPDEDLEATAAAVLKGEDGYDPPPALIEEPPPPTAEPTERNLQYTIMAMSVGQRLKLALKGNRDARTILMRDPNVIVQRFLVENPRLTDEEVIAMSKSRTLDAEILGRVAKRPEWTRNYQVRLALVTNPRTPLPIAIRFVQTLADRDIRALAKNRNVSAVIASTARRVVATRDR